MQEFRSLRIAAVFLSLCCASDRSIVADESSDKELSASELSETELVARIQPSVTTIRVQGRDGDEIGIGTGFVIDSQGLIATNFHVINEGRPFTVETNNGSELPVLAVEASDVANDLALIRVDATGADLPSLELANSSDAEQGMRVLAFGNPHGLRNSVVEGIISATREVEGRELLQLAMPIDPGNSGGPLVDLTGRVHGIINMKSAIDENLGFAIPIKQLTTLAENRNPITMQRWVRLGRINEDRWKPMMGAEWQQRGGRIIAQGLGKGFGGRSLLLNLKDPPELPFELAVNVRLNDESGAAGLVFHSDGRDRHYGFYPSGGRLRLSCFRGPTAFSWQVQHEIESDHYLPGQWNELKVRVEEDLIRCFVNGHPVITSNDRQLTSGKVGLAKFRNTKAEFTGFQIGRELATPSLSEDAKLALEKLEIPLIDVEAFDTSELQALEASGDLASRELLKRAMELEQQAKRVRQFAEDVRRAQTLGRLTQLSDADESERLLLGTLLIAKLDNPDLDVAAYRTRIDEMASEIAKRYDESASAVERRNALDKYLFEENGFHGSRSEYYHSANSHLNRVIDDREGLPITMSVLYMELGQRLGLAIEGVGLPGHFVARHVIDETDSQLVDVFEQGELLDSEDAERLVAMHAGRAIRDSDLQASSADEILIRILNNLIGIAGRNNDGEAMLRYCDAMVAVDPGEPQFRLMRAQLRGMTGRIKSALEDIDSLLEDDSAGIDRAMTERLKAALLDRR